MILTASLSRNRLNRVFLSCTRTAAVPCVNPTKNEGNMEFSGILEAICIEQPNVQQQQVPLYRPEVQLKLQELPCQSTRGVDQKRDISGSIYANSGTKRRFKLCTYMYNPAIESSRVPVQPSTSSIYAPTGYNPSNAPASTPSNAPSSSNSFSTPNASSSGRRFMTAAQFVALATQKRLKK